MNPKMSLRKQYRKMLETDPLIELQNLITALTEITMYNPVTSTNFIGVNWAMDSDADNNRLENGVTSGATDLEDLIIYGNALVIPGFGHYRVKEFGIIHQNSAALIQGGQIDLLNAVTTVGVYGNVVGTGSVDTLSGNRQTTVAATSSREVDDLIQSNYATKITGVRQTGTAQFRIVGTFVTLELLGALV